MTSRQRFAVSALVNGAFAFGMGRVSAPADRDTPPAQPKEATDRPASKFELNFSTSVELFELLHEGQEALDRWCRGWEGESYEWGCSFGQHRPSKLFIKAEAPHGVVASIKCEIYDGNPGAGNALGIVGFYSEYAYTVSNLMSPGGRYFEWEGFTNHGRSREHGAVIKYYANNTESTFEVMTAAEARRRQ